MGTTLIHLLLISVAIGCACAVNCTGLANGNYEVSCRAYALCTNGVVSRVECPHNTVYNNNTAACDDPARVPPPCGVGRDCTGKSDGLYADFDQSCASYYTCLEEKWLGHTICPLGLVFDKRISTCNWRKSVPPPCGIAPVG